MTQHADGCNFELIGSGFVVDTDPDNNGDFRCRLEVDKEGVRYNDGYEEGITHSWDSGGCAPLSEEYVEWSVSKKGYPPFPTHSFSIKFNFCPVCGVKLT